ncbi:MAG: D-alanyl-D-alanine dipeptidase [Pedosphaera sp.]|nr:D-alanyl-D-alanine dipeptidase [Pedosphaera sp.]
MSRAASAMVKCQRNALLVAALLLCIVCASCKDEDTLVNVEKLIPGIVLDIRYATTNNFTGKQLYPVAKCYLRKPAAENLKLVQEDLHGMGYALKVFDAYRPLSVQKKMWEVYPHEGFVANPAKGSRHNRGAAVDLTLITLDGKEVPMPTGYDDFTEKAHRRYMDLPENVIKNRKLLSDVMRKHGFHGLPTEWWHFDFQNSEKYEILDIDYSAIGKGH